MEMEILLQQIEIVTDGVAEATTEDEFDNWYKVAEDIGEQFNELNVKQAA